MNILGWLIVPGIIYYIVRGAVHEGVYNVLIEYDKYKRDEQDKN